MIFESITLENFGPFYEKNNLELSVNSSSPVIVIHGENGRGKTSFLKAIKWCLYGKVIGPDQVEIPEVDFANWDARDSGDQFTTSVEISFVENSEIFNLKRWFKAHLDPTNKNRVILDAEGVDLISQNGNAYPSEDISSKINEILHEDIAEFYLFDGEELEKFESKLRNSSASVDFVRDSIEKALGLPSLTSLDFDLTVYKKQIDKEIQESLKSEKKAKDIIDDINKINTQIKNSEENIAKLTEMIEKTYKRKSEIEPIIQANFVLKEKFEKRNELEENIQTLKKENELFITEISEVFNEKFWIASKDKVSQWKSTLSDKIEKSSADLNNLSQSNMKRATLLTSLEKDSCDTCGQKLSQEYLDKLKNEITKLESENTNYKNMESEYSKFLLLKREISSILDTENEFGRISLMDENIRRNSIKVRNMEDELRDLKKLLETANSDFEKHEKEFGDILSTIQQIESSLPKVQESLSKDKMELQNKQKQLNEMQSDGAPLKKISEILESQLQIFQGAVEIFRELMRKEVEAASSIIFSKLTYEPDYAGLQINSKYYLQIFDQNGRIIQRRAAGVEQIVAMSLIGGLISCAVKEAPVAIDTPMARLDKTHRKNIYTWLPQMAPQVILFVTSSEFDSSTDKKSLGNSIGREYELSRISASRTEFRKYSHV